MARCRPGPWASPRRPLHSGDERSTGGRWVEGLPVTGRAQAAFSAGQVSPSRRPPRAHDDHIVRDRRRANAPRVESGCRADQPRTVRQGGLPMARSGDLQVTKECSEYTGRAGDFCTITSSNLEEIAAGAKVIYAEPAGEGTLDTDVVLDRGRGTLRRATWCSISPPIKARRRSREGRGGSRDSRPTPTSRPIRRACGIGVGHTASKASLRRTRKAQLSARITRVPAWPVQVGAVLVARPSAIVESIGYSCRRRSWTPPRLGFRRDRDAHRVRHPH